MRVFYIVFKILHDTIYLPKQLMKTKIRSYISSPALWVLITVAVLGIGILSVSSASSENLMQTNNNPDEDVIGSYWKNHQSGSIAGVERSRIVGPSAELEAEADRYDHFIGIDLRAMELYWYENGRVSYSYPILSSEEYMQNLDIPDGQHRVHYRNDRHLSSDGVYIPYTQQFHNNIAIHGWPTKRNEERVKTDFQGDSIRLSTRDAEQLYNMTSSDTPVIVSSGRQVMEDTSQQPPLVTATGYIIADIDTGEILAQRRANREFSIASITKLMTAVVARENNRNNDPIYISENAVATYGNTGGLTAGQSLPIETMYLPLLLDSSNDAATAIAEHYEYDRFMEMMNAKARTLGMRATYFDDPSGLSDQNVSNGHDLLRLARYIWSYHQPVLDTTTVHMKTAVDPYSDGLRNFTNNNPVVGISGYRGGKNGYTDRARHTLLSIFSVETQDSPRNIAIIVLGAENRGDDTRTLLRWVRSII